LAVLQPKDVGTDTETATADVLVVTATPLPDTETPTPTETSSFTSTPTFTLTPEFTNTITPTQTSVASLAISSLTDLGGGTVNVSWTASGDFSKGFQVVWSSTNSLPIFPTDSSTYISDVNARSAQFRGVAGKLYYVRVCRYMNDTCDLYSNVQQVSLSANVVYNYSYGNDDYNNNYNYYQSVPYIYRPTEYQYIVPTATSQFSKPLSITPGSPYVYIAHITPGGAGGAYIFWRTSGDFEHGYRLLYSKTNSNLTFGDSLQYQISDPNIHEFRITGAYNTTYYFRICRDTGTNCDLYSNTVSYTFTDN
jgi:hypothetical protein